MFTLTACILTHERLTMFGSCSLNESCFFFFSGIERGRTEEKDGVARRGRGGRTDPEAESQALSPGKEQGKIKWLEIYFWVLYMYMYVSLLFRFCRILECSASSMARSQLRLNVPRRRSCLTTTTKPWVAIESHEQLISPIIRAINFPRTSLFVDAISLTTDQTKFASTPHMEHVHVHVHT